MTMHYHGGPLTPTERIMGQMAGRSFCVSYAARGWVEIAHKMGQAVMLDNGAFSAWRAGKPTDWPGYYRWVEQWLDYRTTWAVIPDVIDGSEEENDALIAEWPHGTAQSCPVWHLHESLDRLERIADEWPMLSFGSSGQFATVGTIEWHARVSMAFDALAKRHKRLPWIHMLRGMILGGSEYPFASLDSTNIARNHNRQGKREQPETAREMADRIDALQCPGRWRVEHPVVRLEEKREIVTVESAMDAARRGAEQAQEIMRTIRRRAA